MKKPILIAAASTIAIVAVAATAQARPSGDYKLPGDTNGDWQLTRAEADIHASATFSAMAKADGAPGISKQDFMTYKPARYDEAKAKARMEAKQRSNVGARFAYVDINMDGAITIEEFTSAKGRDDGNKADRTAMFNEADANGNGSLTPLEFSSIGQERRDAVAEKRAKDRKARRADYQAKLFARLDTDGNGVITETEYLGHHSARFERADQNNDGVLNGPELRRYAHHGKGKHGAKAGVKAGVHMKGRGL